MPKTNLTIKERLMAKVKITPYCWEWTACLNMGGYGTIRKGGTMSLAHRVIWELAHGPIPEGMFILHHCDNRKCVNPEHLFIGTQTDNMRDMYKKGREPKKDAENNGNSKLTWKDVYLIRSIYPALSTYKLGKQFGVSNVAIHQIVKNKIWKSNSKEKNNG